MCLLATMKMTKGAVTRKDSSKKGDGKRRSIKCVKPIEREN